jgi:hypothetical protein
MRRRIGLLAGCLAGLTLAACGGGRVHHVVETTGPGDPARATRPGFADHPAPFNHRPPRNRRR